MTEEDKKFLKYNEDINKKNKQKRDLEDKIDILAQKILKKKHSIIYYKQAGRHLYFMLENYKLTPEEKVFVGKSYIFSAEQLLKEKEEVKFWEQELKEQKQKLKDKK